MGFILCAERVNRYIKRKHYERSGEWKFELCDSRRIFSRFKTEVWRRVDETIKVVKLKKVEQESRIMEEFVQEFKRAARESGYERRPLIEEFKWEMNKVIRRKLMKIK